MTEEAEAPNSTVDRALRVLEAFLGADAELGVLELSRQLDLDKSVIHRILSTLVRRRFLEQDAVTRRYRVGLRTWELGRRYLAGHHLEQLAERELARVVSSHPYATAYFSTLDDADVVVVDTIRGPGPINVYIDPGTRMSAEGTATGRALLACLPDESVLRLLHRRPAPGRGARATPGVDELSAAIAAIRESGHSVSRGEYAPGIGTVAVAVRSLTREPLGALSIDFLIAPETESLWDELPRELRQSADEIERAIRSR